MGSSPWCVGWVRREAPQPTAGSATGAIGGLRAFGANPPYDPRGAPDAVGLFLERSAADFAFDLAKFLYFHSLVCQ
jgi:hypothetical protein